MRRFLLLFLALLILGVYLLAWFITCPGEYCLWPERQAQLDSWFAKAPITVYENRDAWTEIGQDKKSAVIPLDKPNMNTAALLAWAVQAATDTMTFTYDEYQKNLQQSSRYFTKAGWESFAAAIQRSHIIESVVIEKQKARAKVTGPPSIIQEGVSQGKYRWSIKIPLELTYSNSQAERTDRVSLTLVIERSAENKDGVGIVLWQAF